MRRTLLVLGLFLALAISSTSTDMSPKSKAQGSKLVQSLWTLDFGLWTNLGLPVFGTDVNVSGTASANETTIASNPTNPLNFVGGANASGGTGRYTTTDGGLTWAAGVLGGIGDPTVTFDGAGNAYFAQLSTGTCPDPAIVYKSTDGGIIWGGAVQALSDPSPSDHFIDKDWIA